MAESAATGPSSRVLGANALFAGVSSASAVLLLLLQAIITRVLGQTVFGRFSWALTLAMLGEALMDFGVLQITIRAVARDRTRAAHLFHTSLALKSVTGGLMFVLMAALSYGLAADAELWHATLVMLGVAVLRSYVLTIRGVLQGLEQFGRDCLIVVGDRVLVLVIASVAVWNGFGLLGIAVAFAVARVFALGLSFALVSSQAGGVRLNVDRALWGRLQREALPIGMFLVLLNFYSYIDTVMLGVLSTFEDTGLYASAYRLYEGLAYAPAALSAVLTPRLVHLWSNAGPAHARLARLSVAGTMGLAAVIALPIWMLADPLLTLTFGPSASDASGALRVLALGLVPVFGIWMLHAVAISVFKERLLLVTTATGAVANAALNLWLIPRYGRNGAAVATALGETLTMGMLVWGLRSVFWRPAPRP